MNKYADLMREVDEATAAYFAGRPTQAQKEAAARENLGSAMSAQIDSTAAKVATRFRSYAQTPPRSA